MFHTRDKPVPTFCRGGAIRYIAAQSDLDSLTEELGAHQSVAFDTEFLREKTYYPVLCLAQIALGDSIALVDPLAELDFDRFWSVLLDRTIVLHSGRQDLEVMLRSAGRLPGEIYDTQIAAGLAGLAPQVGYASLVSRFCDVELAKAHTRTNWSRRPLADAVLRYAEDDVRYLGDVQHALQGQLGPLGRETWVSADCAELLDPDKYDADADNAWLRIKGVRGLPKIVQQRAAALAAWRERAAQRRDLPRQWLLRDDALTDLCFNPPEGRDDLADHRGVGKRLAASDGDAMLGALRGPLPEVPPVTPRADPEQRALQKRMAVAVREVAASLHIESEVLAPQRELRQAAAGERDIRALRGWRAPLLEPVLGPLLPD